jgi:hypothetical protein
MPLPDSWKVKQLHSDWLYPDFVTMKINTNLGSALNEGIGDLSLVDGTETPASKKKSLAMGPRCHQGS